MVAVVAQLFEMFDQDHDGVLRYAEFVRAPSNLSVSACVLSASILTGSHEQDVIALSILTGSHEQYMNCH